MEVGKRMNWGVFACLIVCVVLAFNALVTSVVQAESVDNEAGTTLLESERQEDVVSLDPFELNDGNIQSWLDTHLPQWLEEYNVPGALIAVVHNGHILAATGYGEANVATGQAVTPDNTLFRLGSLSKVVTATVAMQLVEDGTLDLHTDINEYLHEARIDYAEEDPVTLFHLLTHTSGLDESYVGLSAFEEAEVSLLDHLLRYMPRPVRAPGQFIQYSNHGYGLIGQIIEDVTGVPFDEYVHTHLFTPLQMEQSTFDQDALLDADRTAQSYVWRANEYHVVNTDWIHLYPSGSLLSTARDMAHFMNAHLQGGQFDAERILAEETVQQMHTGQFSNHPLVNGVGFGFFEGEDAFGRLLMHDGGIDAFFSSLYLRPDAEFGLFISTNSEYGTSFINRVHTELMDSFFEGEETERVDHSSPMTMDELARFDGGYFPFRMARYGPEKTIRLITPEMQVMAEDDGVLRIDDALGQYGMAGTYVQQADDRFRLVDGNQEIVLEEAADGSFYIHAGATTMEKVHARESKVPHVLFLITALTAFGLTVVLIPVFAIIRKMRNKHSEPFQTKLRKVAWSLSFLHMLFFLGALVILGNIMYGYLIWAYFVVLLPIFGLVYAIWLFFLWNDGRKEPGASLWMMNVYLMLAIIGVLMVPFAWYWDLTFIALLP